MEKHKSSPPGSFRAARGILKLREGETPEGIVREMRGHPATVQCPECEGEGSTWDRDTATTNDCPTCAGTGSIPAWADGWVQVAEWFDLEHGMHNIANDIRKELRYRIAAEREKGASDDRRG